MADLKRWPWALNQPGYDYPAEYLRAQHFDATSGGNGVGSPTACKVVAQTAADGTVSILPGGATARSTYAGAEGQSYHMHVFAPIVVEVPQTGSASGGRHDLLVLRVSDPQYGDYPPGAPRRELTPEEAAEYDFWYPHLVQGTSANHQPDYPHVKLAHIRRGPNMTIVTDDDIRDLRELATPKNHIHMRAANLYMSEEQSLHTGGDGTTPFVWPRTATHTVHIPDWAEEVQIQATWGSVRASHVSPGMARGVAHVYLTNPAGRTIRTQQSAWRYAGGERNDRFNIVLGDDINIPADFRGQDCTVELRGVKRSGPNIYMDGDSTWSLILYFEQDIS